MNIVHTVKHTPTLTKNECRQIMEDYLNRYEEENIKYTKPIMDMLKIIRHQRGRL